MLPASLFILYLNVNDWHDDVYTVDERGELRIQYRTLLRYRSVRHGPISALQNTWTVQRGLLRWIFKFGDIYLQVGWSRLPFCLRDVQNPGDVERQINRVADHYRENPPGQEGEAIDVIGTLLEQYEDMETDGVKVHIGKENSCRYIQDCTIITCNYKIKDRTIGALGAIGPTRMEYGKVITVVKYLSHILGNILEDIG